MSILFMSILAAEEFHDIAPPVDYSLIPPWLIFVGTFFALAITGLVVWLIAQKRKRPRPPQLPRDRALEALEQMRDQIDRLNPYQFSIREQEQEQPRTPKREGTVCSPPIKKLQVALLSQIGLLLRVTTGCRPQSLHDART